MKLGSMSDYACYCRTHNKNRKCVMNNDVEQLEKEKHDLEVMLGFAMYLLGVRNEV